MPEKKEPSSNKEPYSNKEEILSQIMNQDFSEAYRRALLLSFTSTVQDTMSASSQISGAIVTEMVKEQSFDRIKEAQELLKKNCLDNTEILEAQLKLVSDLPNTEADNNGR